MFFGEFSAWVLWGRLCDSDVPTYPLYNIRRKDRGLVVGGKACFADERVLRWGVGGSGSRILQATCFGKLVLSGHAVSTNTSWPRDVVLGTPSKS